MIARNAQCFAIQLLLWEHVVYNSKLLAGWPNRQVVPSKTLISFLDHLPSKFTMMDRGYKTTSHFRLLAR
jgi:hypothetical protein